MFDYVDDPERVWVTEIIPCPSTFRLTKSFLRSTSGALTLAQLLTTLRKDKTGDIFQNRMSSA